LKFPPHNTLDLAAATAYALNEAGKPSFAAIQSTPELVLRTILPVPRAA
jgi:hypothetical protein